MRSAELIQFLKGKFDVTTDQALRRILGLSSDTLNNWRKRRTLTSRIVGEQSVRLANAQLKGSTVVSQLQGHMRTKSLRTLANRIGITETSVQMWKARRVVTARQIAGLVRNASKAGASNYRANAIRPLVEFFRIEKCESSRGRAFEVFSTKEEKGKSDHPYRFGLKEELSDHFGVYIFFDSRGRAIYAGKARRQKLWREINSAYNRDRGRVQNIKRVRHPENRVEYRTSDEKARQISEATVPLHELATYFSAYQVEDGMIEDLESLLVRSFANDLLNIRMERFSRYRTAQTVRRRRKRRRRR